MNLKINNDTIEVDGIIYKREIKPKTVLFTTEDGVDVFYGVIFWNVSNEFNIIDYQITNDKYKLDFLKNYKQFSTKQAAEEYILMNKPCLSINDFYSFSSCQAEEQNTHRKLKELVKSKL